MSIRGGETRSCSAAGEGGAGGFPATRLSVVRGASSPDPELRQRALETLAAAYWFVAANSPLEGRYYDWEIMLPGGAVGAIVGYATWKFGRAPQRQAE